MCANECASGTAQCDGTCEAPPPPENFGETCERPCYCQTGLFSGFDIIGPDGTIGCDGQCSQPVGLDTECFSACTCARSDLGEPCTCTCDCGVQVPGETCFGSSCFTTRAACEEACSVQVDPPPVEAMP